MRRHSRPWKCLFRGVISVFCGFVRPCPELALAQFGSELPGLGGTPGDHIFRPHAVSSINARGCAA